MTVVVILMSVLLGSIVGSVAGVYSVDLWFKGQRARGALLGFGTLALGIGMIMVGFLGAQS